jgi:hypothetical protein
LNIPPEAEEAQNEIPKMPSSQIRSYQVPGGARIQQGALSTIKENVSRHSGHDSGLPDAGASTLTGADTNL